MPEPQKLIERIHKFNAPLLQDKVMLKYALMAKNVYGFYRATCHLFYEDLASETLPDSPIVWICGDLHLENFGSYKGDNRQVYFDLNDFDESILAPASWELVRMVTSIFVSFTALKIDDSKAIRMARLFLKNYSNVLSKGKSRYIDSRTADGVIKRFLTSVKKRKQKQLLNKKTTKVKGELKLIADGRKQEKIDNHLKRDLLQHLNDWIKVNDKCPYHYEAIDVAFRIAGTGSLGIKRYVALLRGTNDRSEYLFLDMKAARNSSLEPYSSTNQPQWKSHAHRIVAIQERVQNIAPALFSTSQFNGEPYVMQELQPLEDNINFDLIKNVYRDIYKVIDDMAMLTASGQLRSSGRDGSSIADDLITFSKKEDWQEQIITYAQAYSSKVNEYYTQFLKGYDKKTKSITV